MFFFWRIFWIFLLFSKNQILKCLFSWYFPTLFDCAYLLEINFSRSELPYIFFSECLKNYPNFTSFLKEIFQKVIVLQYYGSLNKKQQVFLAMTLELLYWTSKYLWRKSRIWFRQYFNTNWGLKGTYFWTFLPIKQRLFKNILR